MTRLLNYFKTSYDFPPLVWYLIIQTALARSAYFLVMPFIAIKMQDIPSTTAMEIGAVLGVGPLVGTLAGFYIGHLSDILGRRKILFFALGIWVIIFVGFAHASTALEFAFLMIFNGLARAAYEPVASALISDLCKLAHNKELLKKAFHMRYLLINLGAAIAPPLGAYMYLYDNKASFYCTSSIYFFSALVFLYYTKKLNLKSIEALSSKSTIRFKQVLTVLAKDKLLRLYLLAYLILSLGFAQIDFALALQLKSSYHEEGVKLFAKLLSFNGIIIVLITLPLLEWSKKFDLHLMCAISSLFWAVGYLGFAFASEVWHFYLGMLFITFGEIIIFANGNLLIENLAPEQMKGAYMGSLNVGFAGIIIGPLVGGMILDYSGSKLLFSFCMLLMIGVSLIYIRIKSRLLKI